MNIQGIEEEILPSQIIGYSSGLNENLQRAFMKNAIQYLDVMNIKRQWEQRLAVINAARNEKGKHLTEMDIELLERQSKEAYQLLPNSPPLRYFQFYLKNHHCLITPILVQDQQSCHVLSILIRIQQRSC